MRPTLLLAMFFTGIAQPAAADEYHYNNFIIGDRASGMGGAYTAVSDDATGLFYNPSAIVYSGDKNVSASVNSYFRQIKKYENVIGNNTFQRNSSTILANFFGVIKPLGDYKIGFSYAVPDASSEDQNQSFNNISSTVSRYTINLNNRDNTSNFGPSFAAAITNDLAVGITLYVHQRDSQLILNQFNERADGTNGWSNKYFKLSETGIKPVLGISWSPFEKLSLGFSASQTFLLNSKAETQQTCWDASNSSPPDGRCSTGVGGTPSIKVPRQIPDDYKRVYPMRLAVGAAYFADNNLLVSGDLTYYSKVPTDQFYGEKIAVINAALGTEYYLSKKWAVRAGAFTNMANTPAIRANAASAEENINLYGCSLSVSNFTGSSSVTLGGSLSYGKGNSQILTNSGIQNANSISSLAFLSSSF